MQKYLQDPLADAILRGEVKDGMIVRIEEGDGALELLPQAKGDAAEPADEATPAAAAGDADADATREEPAPAK